MSEEHMRYGVLNWKHDFLFSAGAKDKPTIPIDGHGVEGPSPVVTLLLAVGACTGSDVVDILRKQKVELKTLQIEVKGRRREDWPKRYTEMTIVFKLAGEGVTKAKVERAVELSVTKYCSVGLSLNPDIAVKTEIIIE